MVLLQRWEVRVVQALERSHLPLQHFILHLHGIVARLHGLRYRCVIAEVLISFWRSGDCPPRPLSSKGEQDHSIVVGLAMRVFLTGRTSNVGVAGRERTQGLLGRCALRGGAGRGMAAADGHAPPLPLAPSCVTPSDPRDCQAYTCRGLPALGTVAGALPLHPLSQAVAPLLSPLTCARTCMYMHAPYLCPSALIPCVVTLWVRVALILTLPNPYSTSNPTLTLTPAPTPSPPLTCTSTPSALIE